MPDIITRREALAALGGAGLAASFAGAAERPNILFLFSDDHHWQALGAAGNPHIHTPHLDQLAKRGVLFRGATVATAQCCPSRGALLSGRYGHASGLRSNGARDFRPNLGPMTMGELRRAGYHTALIGKWHILPRPTECGFAEVRTWLPGGGSRYTDPALARGAAGKPQPVTGHITDIFADDAIQFLEQKRDAPFFLWLAFNAPHSPLAPSDYREEELARYRGKTAEQLAPPSHGRWNAGFDWAIYYTAITRLDRAIGRIVQSLEQTGQAHHTVVIFMGDNGFLCGAHEHQGKVLPWEASVRVPLLAYGPGIAAGAVNDDPISSIDLPATWLDLAGATVPAEFHGQSLAPVLAGKARRSLAYCQWDDGAANALATGEVVEPYRQVRSRTHKYVVWESGREECYAYKDDPEERENLHDRFGLKEQLQRWMKSFRDPALEWGTRPTFRRSGR